MTAFPSMRWPKLRRILERKPLEYTIVRQSGSHIRMTSSAGYPPLNLGFHDKSEIPPGLVRKILMDRVGLTETDARKLL